MTRKYAHLDSDETIFFERELEHIKSQTFDKLYAPLRAFELIPVNTDADPAVETITYRQYDKNGRADIVGDGADDLPQVNVAGKEFISKVVSIGNSYSYTLQEIRAARLTNKSLSARLANAALESQRRRWNDLAFNGDAEYNVQGWLSNSSVPSATVQTRNGNTTWANKVANPDDIIADLNEGVETILNNSNGAEQPNTVVMPLDKYNLLSSTRLASGTDTSILNYFIQQSPFIDSVEWANELKGAFSGSTDGFIVYDRSPDKMTLEMPQMFEQLPVQELNLKFRVPCHSRFGGVLIYYPLSQVFRYGI